VSAEFQNTITELEKRVEALEQSGEEKMTMVVFSGDLDRLLAALIIATGAAAYDVKVVLFFTFWGVTALRRPEARVKGKSLLARMFGFMLPKGRNRLKLSKLNMGGLGTSMMKHLMHKKNVMGLDQLFEQAAELGVEIKVCEMSMDLMGFTPDEMIDYPHLEYVGVGTYLGHALDSKVPLFI